MNKLSTQQRAQILGMMVEGMSLRSITRMTGVSRTTTMKFLADAGQAFSEYQDKTLRNLPCKRVQVDETWAFCYAKQKNVATAKAAPEGAGDVWTWIGLDADTKLAVAWYIGDRNAESANIFIDDLAGRLANRVQLTTDGFKPYLDAVDTAFGGNVDYAMLVKLYGTAPAGDAARRYSPVECIGAKKNPIIGKPEKKHISTSFVERLNLNIRMGNRRFTRLTNAFSKKVENHAHSVSLYFMHYNFVRIHQTLRVTPAMAAGVTDRLWELTDLVRIVDEWEAPQSKF
jgi:IS1 family transposase